MIRLILALVSLLSAGQAAALSCVMPDVVNAYRFAAEAEESYVVLLGEFSFRPTGQPKPLNNDPNQAQPAPATPASFSGYALSGDGFGRRLRGTIMLEPVCWGPWCGGFPEQGRAMAFVLKEGDSYRLQLDPCFGTHFHRPTGADIARVEACHRGEACEAE